MGRLSNAPKKRYKIRKMQAAVRITANIYLVFEFGVTILHSTLASKSVPVYVTISRR